MESQNAPLVPPREVVGGDGRQGALVQLRFGFFTAGSVCVMSWGASTDMS